MTKRVPKDKQIQLIMECRQSGLSDYQWCEKNGIYPGTFYNWVSKLRKTGYTFPESSSKIQASPSRQDVVRVDFMDDVPLASPAIMEQNTSVPIPNSIEPSILAEVSSGNYSIRIFSTATPDQIRSLLGCLGGGTHAW